MRLGGLNKALARGHIIVLGFELRRGIRLDCCLLEASKKPLWSHEEHNIPLSQLW